MKNVIRVLIIGLIIGVSFKQPLAMGQFFFMENEVQGKPAKDFTLKNTEGKDVNFTAFRQGQNAIIFFWATWCPHCREQLKHLNNDREQIDKQGVKLAIVDLGEPIGIVNNYATKNDIKLHIFLDENSELADPYGLVGVPTFYFVNKEGVVTAVEHALPDNYMELFNK